MTGEPTARGIPRADWAYAARRAWHGFMRHRGIDAAATLAFFSALTLFPAALVIVSSLAIGNGKSGAAEVILDLVDEVAQTSTVEAIRDPLTELFTVTNPGIALAVGLVLLVWTLSTYSTAFGRAVNGVYEVHEGRQIWKFRGLMVLLALFLLVLFSAIVPLLITTPRLAAAIGQSLGVGEPWLTIWSIGRWPVLLLLVTVVTGVLYYAAPNLHRQRVRWVSFGAGFAIIAGGLATGGFALYVSTVAPYDKVYGWLGGSIALLLWLYLINLVLVLGAEVDAEVVRLRQLTAGMAAEETIQLPLRDSTRNLMLARQLADDIAEGRAIRLKAEAAD